MQYPLARILCLLVAAALALTACSKPRPLVQQRWHTAVPGELRRVAVMPFQPGPSLQAASPLESRSSLVALVASFVAEALAARGLTVIPPSDVEIAFMGEGRIAPRGDPRAAAAQVAHSFGARAVLLGEVLRYRNRSGGAAGSLQPAAVSLRVQLYSAPGGELLWTGAFDEVQPSLTADPLRARLYPGRGTRWLDAAELARFGAESLADALAEWLGSGVP